MTDTARRLAWPALLVAASLVLSLGLACAVPLAGFAAAAALTLGRRAAVATLAAVWLVNQVAGFAALGYPWDASTLTWGGVLGAVAIGATMAAAAALRRFPAGSLAGAAGAFAAAFVAYEGGLFLVSALVLGGAEAHAPAIVLQILAVNLSAFVALAGIAALLRRVGAPALTAGAPRAA